MIQMSSTIPFVSTQPKRGNPPLHWAAFENPKLGRFPGGLNGFRLGDYLGGGEDGFGFKPHVEEYGFIAIKVVGLRTIQLPIYFNLC